MSYQTPQGLAYTLKDIERLISIDAFHQYTGAVRGLVQRIKQLEQENEYHRQNVLLAESYKEQFLILKREVEELKK